ncbi:MAG: hypothetical protein A2X31_04880 [Elusimicrobia bacterium GWB2_63_22]|nr:MAG: hypothetical protein A2X31_04880 [Elusimicrobia bacterium GWB2_63_22]
MAGRRGLAGLCALLLLPAAAVAQPAMEVSTAPAAQSPLTLNITKDSYDSRVGLDYSLRWDFSDLLSFRPRLGLITEGVRAIVSWDITENTRLNYYGLRTNPWRLIIAREKKSAPAAPGGGGVVSPATPEYRKRVRLSISPLVDDIKRNFDEGLRDFLLRSSLKDLSPEWERAGQSGRKAFMKDVLSLGIWDYGVPVVRETGQGLDYISR